MENEGLCRGLQGLCAERQIRNLNPELFWGNAGLGLTIERTEFSSILRYSIRVRGLRSYTDYKRASLVIMQLPTVGLSGYSCVSGLLFGRIIIRDRMRASSNTTLTVWNEIRGRANCHSSREVPD